MKSIMKFRSVTSSGQRHTLPCMHFVPFLAVILVTFVIFPQTYISMSTVNTSALTPSTLSFLFRNRILPTLEWSAAAFNRHKGEMGRLGIVGGCAQYHGAPYYAGMSSLRAGADLVSVFCTASAAVAIKSLTPELMVNPLLPESLANITDDAVLNARHDILAALPRIRTLVIGPGLGRDPVTLSTVASVLPDLVNSDTPIVLDGDALYLVSTRLDLLHDFKGRGTVVLTPNAGEFRRLYDAAFPDSEPVDWSALNQASTALFLDAHKKATGKLSHDDELESPYAQWLTKAQLPLDIDILQPALRLARHLGVIIVQKGPVDIITDGSDLALFCAIGGSPRRCGGQGDVLAALSALFLSYGRATAGSSTISDEPLLKHSAMIGLWNACATVRTAAQLAFAENGRATTTTDIIGKLHPAML